MVFSEKAKAAGRAAYAEARAQGASQKAARVEYCRARRKVDPDVDRKAALVWYYKNKDRAQLAGRVRYERDPDRNRDYSRRYTAKKNGHAPPDPLGPSLTQLISAQGGRCCICTSKGNLVLDHCHETGKIRGGLCARCNRGLGFFKDNPTVLRIAANYLEAS